MHLKFSLLLLCSLTCYTSSGIIPASRGKQHKFFPKELKQQGVYLGMSLEKFNKKLPIAVKDTVASLFKIKYTMDTDNAEITAFTYLFTPTETPQLYAIEIVYSSIDQVREHAIEFMGKPNHKGEWRFSEELIKEDFMMGAWTFGQKIVYGSTLMYGEWQDGFND